MVITGGLGCGPRSQRFFSVSEAPPGGFVSTDGLDAGSVKPASAPGGQDRQDEDAAVKELGAKAGVMADAHVVRPDADVAERTRAADATPFTDGPGPIDARPPPLDAGVRDAADNDARASALALGLVGRWTLDETSGTLAMDSSGKGNHGTLVGNPRWSTDSFPGAR